MGRKKTEEFIEESIRLSSGVTVIVKAPAALYDTLSIQRLGGVVTIALPGARSVSFTPRPSSEYVAPAGHSEDEIAAIRANLEAQFKSPVDAPITTSRDVVSPASLGFPSAEEIGLLGGSSSFVGRSNEDTDA